MKIRRAAGKAHGVILSACLTAIIFFSAGATSSDNSSNLTAGPPFTDPARIIDMPDDWKKKPIQHDSAADGADIVVTLDQHLYPALLPAIRKYGEMHNKKIIVHDGTCGISAGMLSNKSADIGGFCCPPALTDRLPGLRFHTLGIAAIALIVNQSNPIDNVSFKQARQIFAGDVNDWSRLSTSDGKKGPGLPVQPVGRLHCKLRPGHWRLLLDNKDLFSANLLEVGAIPDMISIVSSNEQAIGYEVLWNLIHHKNKGPAKVLKINNYNPHNSDDLISGNYPLYRVYNITTWGEDHTSNPDAQKLAEYLLEQTDQLAREHEIVPASRLRQAGWKFRDNELVGERFN